MANWVSNVPISRPSRINDVQPETNLNGVMFSEKIGMMYTPVDGEHDPITPPVFVPPPSPSGNTSTR